MPKIQNSPHTGARHEEEKVSDKKSCENCLQCTGDGCNTICKNLSSWQRDPAMWLDILPTEPGWYWCKNTPDRSQVAPFIKWIDKLNIGHIASGYLWQGPITPHGGAR